jgi:hypothetical protein
MYSRRAEGALNLRAPEHDRPRGSPPRSLSTSRTHSARQRTSRKIQLTPEPHQQLWRIDSELIDELRVSDEVPDRSAEIMDKEEIWNRLQRGLPITEREFDAL